MSMLYDSEISAQLAEVRKRLKKNVAIIEMLGRFGRA